MIIEESRIVITGGASGLGLEMASNLSALDGRVGVLDLNEGALESLSSNYPNIIAEHCDITDPVSTESAINDISERLGGIDVVINNAGILYSAPLLSLGAQGIKPHPIEDWHRVLKVNLDAVFYVTRAATQKMVRSRIKGVIINISSVSASGNAGQSAYSAAKAGVESLTVTWAKELGPWGIRVAAIAPGFTNSDSSRIAMSEKRLEEVAKESALKRLGEIEEVAHAVRFVIENDFLTGTTVHLDGGLRI